MKRSKQACYDKYSETNQHNIEKTWKEIKSLMSLKTVSTNIPTVLSLDNGDTIHNLLLLILLTLSLINLLP